MRFRSMDLLYQIMKQKEDMFASRFDLYYNKFWEIVC